MTSSPADDVVEKGDIDELTPKDEYSSSMLPQPVLTITSSPSGKRKFFGSSENTTVRGMQSRHLTFIALGGTIGTGIFLSAGTSVATAGAGGALVSYMVVGLFVYGVVLTLGEMSSLIPVSGAFSSFGDRFVSPALGFTLGWNYFLQWAFSIPSELVAASIILSYWTQALQTWQWSIIIIVPVAAIQFIHVKVYAETEYWLALVKVVLIVFFIIIGLIFDWGGVIGHPGPGLSNFKDAPFYGGFAGFAQSCTYAFYSFGGVELVSLAAGESAKPHKSVPRAIRITFIRIILFYILTILVIGLCINHNDPTLFSAYDNSDVAASPITTVFQKAGFGAAVHVVNAVLLTAVLSATNSCFYASSRMLLSLARDGKAPRVFGYVTKRGVPVPALMVVIAVSCLTFLTTIWGDGVAFSWFTNITGISALLNWISIAGINIRFRQAFKAQGRDISDLPFVSPLSPYLALLSMTIGLCMFAANGWAATTNDDGKVAQDVVAVYLGVVAYVLLGVGYVIWHKVSKQERPLWVPLSACDFESGAVWGRGGGAQIRKEEAAEKAEEDLRKGYSPLRSRLMKMINSV